MNDDLNIPKAIARLKHAYLVEALNRSGWKFLPASRLLGMTLNGFLILAQRYGMDPKTPIPVDGGEYWTSPSGTATSPAQERERVSLATQALIRNAWKTDFAAKVLGVARSSLWRFRKAHGIYPNTTPNPDMPVDLNIHVAVENLKRDYIAKAIQITGGNSRAMAKLTGWGKRADGSGGVKTSAWLKNRRRQTLENSEKPELDIFDLANYD